MASQGLRRLALIIVGVIAGHHAMSAWDSPVEWWPVLLPFALLAWTIWAAWAYTSRPGSLLPGRTIGAVIPSYNEDLPALQLCVESFMAQTRPVDRLYVVDDHSTGTDTHDWLLAWAADKPNVIVYRNPTNMGKRHSQGYAFADYDADVWVTTDSDTILEPDAIEQLVGPFEDPDVKAVAGKIYGLNWNTNLLTRVIDSEFTSSFATGRASAALVDAVVVTCGGLAAYDGPMIRKYLDAYLNETFLGAPVTAGDDRALTQYGLLEGSTTYQDQAVAYTLLPERMSHLVRQRMRWSASWYRGTIWCIRNLRVSPALWLVVTQALAFWIFTVSLILVAVFLPGKLLAFGAFLIVWNGLLSLLRALRLLDGERRDQTTRQRLAAVAYAPLVSLLYFFVLNPVRWASMFTVMSSSWKTRDTVEVRA